MASNRLVRSALAAAVLAASAPAARCQGLYLEPTRIQGTDAQKEAKVRELRAFVRRYTWGRDALPSGGPDSVENVASPIDGLRNLSRAQAFIVNAGGVNSLAYLLIPAKNRRNYLVVLHHGHACTFDDGDKYGMKRTIQALLDRGYSVLAAHMPQFSPLECLETASPSADQHPSNIPMTAFLEPLARDLNYIEKKFPEYDLRGRGAAMAGLSGGGWMSTLYPAIDPRISRSFDVSGSMPLSLRGPGSMGDHEQYVHEFYKDINYLDLYVMAAWGGRRHTQIDNAHDDCCFGDNANQFQKPAENVGYASALTGRAYGYKWRVVEALGWHGVYELVVDETAHSHTISPASTQRIIDGL